MESTSIPVYDQRVIDDVFSRADKAADLKFLDRDRLERGKEIFLAGLTDEKIAEYETTTRSCTCPDHTYRAKLGPCKHMIAVMLSVRVHELIHEALVAA